MVVDIGVLVLLVGFTVYGYASGLVRGLNALAVPVLGIWLGFRNYPAIAPMVDEVVRYYPASAVISFFLVLGLAWLALRLGRNLLFKLVDWRRLSDLDSFLGGVFGLVKGVAVVGVALAVLVAVFPPCRQFIRRSQASARILELTEEVTGRRITPTASLATPGLTAGMSGLKDAIGSVRKAMEMMRGLESPFGTGPDE